MDRGSWSVLHGSSTTIDVFAMMTVQLICSRDVYKIDVFTNSINLFDTIGRQILWRQQTHRLLFNRGYSTCVYHRWCKCISSLKAPDKGLSEKQITVITQGQAFKFDNSSYYTPRIKSVKKTKSMTNVPFKQRVRITIIFSFYDISNDLCDITVKNCSTWWSCHEIRVECTHMWLN